MEETNLILELLRDGVWQFVGAIITLVTLIVTVAIYFAQRWRKLLTYEVIASTPLLQSNDLSGEIEVNFRGESVDQIYLTVLEVRNSGNVPIVRNDFDGDLTFTLNNENKILSADVIENKPESVSIQLIQSEDSVSIEPARLNGKDMFTIRFVSTRQIEELSTFCRIAGVSNILEASHSSISHKIRSFILIVSAFWTVLIFVIYIFIGEPAVYLGTIFQLILVINILYLWYSRGL